MLDNEYQYNRLPYSTAMNGDAMPRGTQTDPKVLRLGENTSANVCE